MADKEREQLDPEELEEIDGEPLPDREEMAIVDPSGNPMPPGFELPTPPADV